MRPILFLFIAAAAKAHPWVPLALLVIKLVPWRYRDQTGVKQAVFVLPIEFLDQLQIDDLVGHQFCVEYFYMFQVSFRVECADRVGAGKYAGAFVCAERRIIGPVAVQQYSGIGHDAVEKTTHYRACFVL